MHWKRRLKNLPMQEYLESSFKAKCLSSCLSGSNCTEEKQALFKELYKLGWMAFQRIPLNPFSLIAGKRSQTGMIALSFLRIQAVLGKVA